MNLTEIPIISHSTKFFFSTDFDRFPRTRRCLISNGNANNTTNTEECECESAMKIVVIQKTTSNKRNRGEKKNKNYTQIKNNNAISNLKKEKINETQWLNERVFLGAFSALAFNAIFF